jgi:SAM-dependent methyltransferase
MALHQSSGQASMIRGLIRKLRVLKYLDPSQTMSRMAFVKEFRAFKKMMSQSEPRFSLNWEDRYVCMNDRTPSTGFDRHYVYHPAWAARVLAHTKPAFHVDLSSSLNFCSMLSAFVPVKFYDYRPAELDLSNLTSEAADLLALPFADKSINSLSCMHVVEHVGLGRYGDPLDPDGDLKAIAELKRVLAPDGSLLFVVPVGQPKIMFNGHRIYSYDQIINYFAGLELKEFALIPDNPVEGGLICHATKEQSDKQSYGCGCFWFRG